MKIKEIRDEIIKFVTHGDSAVLELQELFEYFQLHGSIEFKTELAKDSKVIIAKSTNFRFGSIITSARNPKELDENIKDAILTAFDIPSVYLSESRIEKVGNTKEARYALA